LDKSVKWLADLTEAEYRGSTFNGKNFADTIRAYTLAQVVSTNTYEKYTVWAVVLHNLYWKWMLLKALEPENRTPYGYEEKSFPALPVPADQKAWEKTLADSDMVHDAYMDVLGRLTERRMNEDLDGWKCTVGAAVGWLATHDSYHTAQIRNMAVPQA
jgi:hypothetical protein